MTISEAIEKLDAQKHNTCTWEEKIGWLSELDRMTRHLLGQPDFPGYDESDPEDTLLHIPAPFDQVYGYYLASKIDYINGEFTRFNNANAMFRATWQTYLDHCIRTGAIPGNAKQFH